MVTAPTEQESSGVQLYLGVPGSQRNLHGQALEGPGDCDARGVGCGPDGAFLRRLPPCCWLGGIL